MGTLEKGRTGEGQARKFLEKKGYRFLAANFRTRLGELDLVMRSGDTVIFVEVKLRATEAFGAPEEAVGFFKQKRMVKAALEYVKTKRLHDQALRFDVVSIGPGGLEHLEDAFSVSAGPYTL